jgi:putative solute:sodium symporter small subunit
MTSIQSEAALQKNYWRRKRTLTMQLLTVWLSSTFLVIYFARDLNDLTLFGWPLSYYMAAQGLALVYLALIVIYNRRVRKMEIDMEQSREQRQEQEAHHAG